MLCVRCKLRYGAVHKIGEGALCPVCHGTAPRVVSTICLRGFMNADGAMLPNQRVYQTRVPTITGRILDDFMAMTPDDREGAAILLVLGYADGSSEEFSRIRRGTRVVTTRTGRD